MALCYIPVRPGSMSREVKTPTCSSWIWTTKWPLMNVSRNQMTTTITCLPPYSKYHPRKCSPQSYSFHDTDPVRTVPQYPNPTPKERVPQNPLTKKPDLTPFSSRFKAQSHPAYKLTSHTTHPKPHNSSQSSPNPSSTQSHSLSPKTESQDLRRHGMPNPSLALLSPNSSSPFSLDLNLQYDNASTKPPDCPSKTQ